MTNRDLAEKIYEYLNKRGAELGNASIGIIHKTLDDNGVKNCHAPSVLFSESQLKDKLLKELTQLAKNNNDIGKFGYGYEKAINEAIQLVKNLSVPDVEDQREQLCDDWIHEERIKHNDDNYCPICGKKIQ